jgi:seryl-tRNA synthetase
MSFEGQIQQWVSLDNQLKLLTNKTKEVREKRNEVEQNITNYASANNLSNATVKISDGKLKMSTTKITEPLTFKYLENTLGGVIKNELQIAQIIEYLKQKRTVKIIPEIKRFSDN